MSTGHDRLGAADAAAGALYAGIAAWIVHRGLGTGEVVGLAWGEAWGRLFVTGQVERWLFGDAPWGHADLIAAPAGRSFWPTDPVFQAIELALGAGFGEATTWALGLAALSACAGIGGHAVARTCGAGPLGALVGGLALQLHPFWLRNGAEGVTEVLATGPVALAAAAAVRAARAPGRGAYALFAIAFAAVAGTSPYHAIYAALTLTAATAAVAAHRPTLARLTAIAGVVGVLFAAPIVATERGEGGRVSAAWQGGYRLDPEPLCQPGIDDCVPTRAEHFERGGEAGRKAPGVLHAALVGWPGGLAGSLLLGLGLASRGGRRAAAAAGAAVLALGPAVGPIGRALGFPHAVGPLQVALLMLPGTGLLGNGNRLFVLPAIAASAVAPRARTPALVALAAVGLTAWLEVPGLALPAVAVTPLPPEVIAAVRGPTVTFPSADPPVWNRGAWPKEGLWYARQHGGPQAFDYGRGGRPADGPLLVELSVVAGVPLSERAWRERTTADPLAAARAAGFTRVLVVRRSLSPEAYLRVRDWLDARLGRPVAESSAATVWSMAAVNGPT